MPRTNLKAVSVYATDEQMQLIQKAAENAMRPVSNYLLVLALEDAEKRGISVMGSAIASQEAKAKSTGGTRTKKRG